MTIKHEPPLPPLPVYVQDIASAYPKSAPVDDMMRELDLRQADRLIAIDDCLKSALDKLPPLTTLGADYVAARQSIDHARQILQLYCRALNEQQRREGK